MKRNRSSSEGSTAAPFDFRKMGAYRPWIEDDEDVQIMTPEESKAAAKKAMEFMRALRTKDDEEGTP